MKPEGVENTCIIASREYLDKEKNQRRVKIVEYFEANGFLALSGRTISDYSAQYTYCSKVGKSINDLVWTNLMHAN